MIIVADSSPLISFEILNKLTVLDQVFDEILIPEAVYNEIAKKNKPQAQKLEKFAKTRVKQIQNRLAVQLLQKDLDIGESEAIVLGIENDIPNILIDDFKGRTTAQAHGLFPIGTIGVLLQAKKKGFIKKVKPELDKLVANHRRISEKLYARALELASEK